MRLSFPKRFPPAYLLAVAGTLFAAAWAEGTEPAVAMLAAIFIVLSGLAFNAAGGLVYPSGAYIFFLSLLTADVGMGVKIFLGEPLGTHLRDVEKSMLVYDGGMLGVYAAAYLNRHLRWKRPVLSNLVSGVRTDQIAMGCVLIGIVGPLLIPEGAASIFNQINNFLPFAVLLPVYARAKETDGRSTFTWIAFGAWVYMTIVFGLMTFSKQGIYLGSVAWAVAAVAAGYRISRIRLVVLAAVAAVAASVLTPYSQIGRQFRGAPDLTDQAIYLLQHPQQTRELYELQAEKELSHSKSDIHWFEHPQGLLDRLTMFPIDDALIAVTDQGHPQSLYVLATYIMNAVPHFLFPDKPNPLWGNQFAHEIGMLSKDDHTTSISFSPFADAYHDGQWLAVLAIAPLMFLLLFFVADSVTGPVDQTVWALFYILYFSHSAPEGMMNTTIYGSTTATLGLIFVAWVIARIAPVLGQLVTLPRSGTAQVLTARP